LVEFQANRTGAKLAMPTSRPKSSKDIAQLAHDAQLLNSGRYLYQVDSARTPHVLASGTLPSSEPVSASFFAGNEYDFDERHQRVVNDDFEPLHDPKTSRGHRRREQAGRASFTTTSKPSIIKPTSTPLSGRRAERDKVRDRERSSSPSPLCLIHQGPTKHYYNHERGT
jgi:hypothetical protein